MLVYHLQKHMKSVDHNQIYIAMSNFEYAINYEETYELGRYTAAI